MLLGDHCCFDIRGGLSAWNSGEPDWGMKCCNNKVAPVKQPPDDIGQEQIKKVGNGEVLNHLNFVFFSAESKDHCSFQEFGD